MAEETPDTPEETGVEATEPEAADVTADQVADAAEGAEAAEPQEQLSAKERRQRERHLAASARPRRSPEERQAEREEERRKKAAARRRRRGQEREKARAARGEAPAPTSPATPPSPGAPKQRQGTVVSDKADKTITVRIDSARRHRRYEKIVRSSATLHAHDEANEANEGDVVRVVESRPLSRTKRWRLVEVLERAK